MKTIKKIWPFIFLLFVLIFSTINSIISGIQENKTAYNFQITKIENTATRTLTFYDREKEITLWNYSVSSNDGVKVGDYLIKDKCAKILFIKRKDENNEFIEITRSNNTSYFANLICN